MKIKSFQPGGIVYVPTVNNNYSGGASNIGASSTNNSGESGKIPAFTKEIMDLVKENGLDSDVQVFLNQVGRVLNLAADPTGENITMREFLKVRQLASSVASNYELYKKAYDSLNAENAWGEVATDKTGNFYVQNRETGKVELISKEELKEADPETIVLLRNEDLLNLRRLDPSLAYNSGILDSIGAAVGTKSIVEYVTNVIKEFQTTEISGYSQKQASKIASGLEHIISGDIGNFRGVIDQGPDGVFKISQKSTIADTNIEAALSYLWNALPTTYQNALDAKSVAEGYTKEALLLQMLIANTGRKITADYDKSATEDLYSRSGKGGNGSETLTQGTLPDDVARGSLTETTFVINPAAERAEDRALMSVRGWNAGPLTDKDKNPIGEATLETIRQNGYATRGANWSQASFGAQHITSQDLKTIVHDGYEQLVRVALPYIYDENGTIVPDLELIVKYNEVLRYAADHPGTTKQEIIDKLGVYSSKCDIDEEGNLTIKQEFMQEFLSFGAYANRDNIELTKLSKQFTKHLDKSEGKRIKADYNHLVQYGKLDVNKKTPKIHSISSAKSNDFYYGNVYIPITDPTQGFRMSNDQYVPRSTFTNVTEKNYLSGITQQVQAQDPWITTMPTN